MLYLAVKLLHIAVAVLFLGNITTGLFWMHHAKRYRLPARIAETMDGIIRSDRLFTLPCALLVAVGGFAAAMLGGSTPILRVGWIAWGLGLFALSGLLFVWLAPLQRRIRDYAARPDAEWLTCQQLLRRWELIGLASLLAAWGALAVMVLKIPR